MDNKKIFTKDGLDALKKELQELTAKKRPEAVKRLSDAREQGDLSENSEYTSAKQDLAFLDGRIAELEEILRGAKVAPNRKRSAIDVGCRVRLHINGKEEIFTLVGEWEANPSEKKISHESPLGKALMGKRIGEHAEVEAPAGKILYKILEIE